MTVVDRTGPDRVRTARAEDVPALLDLLEAVAGEGRWIGRELPLDRATFTDRITSSIEAEDQLLLIAPAHTDGRDVALGSLNLRADNWGHLDLGMYLAADARGQGLGSAMLIDAIAWGRRRPTARKITLQHFPHNIAAHRLYRRFGFTVEGYLHRHWPRVNGELWDAVLMGLLLDRDEPTAG